MKRVSILLVLVMVFSMLAGCSSSGPKIDTSPQPPEIVKPPEVAGISVDLPTVSELVAEDPLPKFDSFASVLSKFEDAEYSKGYAFNDMVFDAIAPQAEAGGSSADRGESLTGGTGDYSTTNVQKQGVDEGDIIKTDGKFIYTVNRNTVAIVGVDGTDVKQYSTVRVDEKIRVTELYVVGDRLVLAGSTFKEFPLPPRPDTKDDEDRYYYWWPETFTRMYTVYNIYDIADRQKPTLLQSFEVSGDNLATRVVGNTLYYVTNQYPSYYAIPFQQYREFDIPVLEEWILPGWDNSVAPDRERVVEAEAVSYFPDSSEISFMMVGSLNLSGSDVSEPQAYFGGGETFYMDAEYMAIACHNWTHGFWSNTVETRVYRFALASDGIAYTGNAKVDGRVIDQYAMDVHNGNLRVATSNTAGNRVSVFDKSMNLVGETKAFAKSESIRSVRFMGDMVYAVTFEVRDPLFCIDLSNPARPEILGELKIPGFSQYLHPVGDGLLVGFGRDTEENEWGWFDDLGFKISLFDVKDPRDPQEIAILTYSNDEFYSDAFTNPRSLLVDKNKGLFMFPVLGTVPEDDFNPVIKDNDVKAYAEGMYPSIWYGMLVIGVADRQLKEVHSIAHGKLKYEDYGTTLYYDDMYYYNPTLRYNVRAVYIGDVLYTVGNGTLSVWDYETFNFVDSLTLN